MHRPSPRMHLPKVCRLFSYGSLVTPSPIFTIGLGAQEPIACQTGFSSPFSKGNLSKHCLLLIPDTVGGICPLGKFVPCVFMRMATQGPQWKRCGRSVHCFSEENIVFAVTIWLTSEIFFKTIHSFKGFINFERKGEKSIFLQVKSRISRKYKEKILLIRNLKLYSKFKVCWEMDWEFSVWKHDL